MRQQHRRAQVDPPQRLPAGRVALQERLDDRQPGDGGEHVGRHARELLRLRAVGQVGGDRRDAGQLGRERVESLAGEVGRRHAGAERVERDEDGEADVAGGAADERVASGERTAGHDPDPSKRLLGWLG